MGFYGALILGANVWQENRGTRTFFNDAGDTLTIDPKTDAGFFGGIKLGYVFGTGTVRFALEEDMFYNGWKRGADSRVVDIDGFVTRTSSSSININSGAFITNGILKFGNHKFQPYIGAGLGGYFAETPGLEVNGFQDQTEAAMLPASPGRPSWEPITILIPRAASSSNTNSWNIPATTPTSTAVSNSTNS